MRAAEAIKKAEIASVTEPGTGSAGVRHSPTFDERIAILFEKTAPLVWIFFSLAYFLITVFVARRLFWFDELFTYYLSGFPFQKMWHALVAGVDQNGPAFYVLTTQARRLVGSPEIGLRIPAIVSGWFVLLTVFLYVRKRSSAAYAWVAVLFLINSRGAYYFDEARPYGLIMACCALSFFAWQRAAERSHRLLSLSVLGCSLAFAGLCHAYAILLYIPLGLGELTRARRERKPDWPVWSAMISSAAVYAVYLPIVRAVHGSLAYTWARPDFGKIPETYESVIGPAWMPLLAMLILAGCLSLLVQDRSPDERTRSLRGLPFHEAVALIALVLLPFAGLALGRLTGIFTGRYVIESIIGVAIALAVLLWRAAGGRASFAMAVCLISISWEVWNFVAVQSATRDQQRPAPIHESAALSGVYDLLPNVERSDLPLVVSSGLMFLEIDHYASPQLAARLHVLIDDHAAIAHTKVDVLDRGLPLTSEWFPVRGKLDPYAAFIASHPHFLVYGYWDSPTESDWLVDRLLRDGAQINILAKTDRFWRLPYWIPMLGDSRDLYLLDVRMQTLK